MNSTRSDVRLGLGSLTGVVVGMMVGSGLYNLPQNIAVSAGPLAAGAAWLVTAAGMLLLVAVFRILSSRRPDLDAGTYQYASEGFGKYAGFNIAWGYWLCTAFANVAYAVMLNDSFGAFFPDLLSHGWPTLLFGTSLIWIMFLIGAGGLKTARFLNNLLVGVKMAAIGLVIVLLAINIKMGFFSLNFLASGQGESLWSGIKGTMMVTLWCFIGIEGAVMLAARARRQSDVGKAGVFGFLIAWLLYVSVSMLCYGVKERAVLAGLPDPSVAYLLRDICGGWAYWFVIISVIVSLLGGWLSWTIVCAQTPYEAAVVGIFPRRFLRLNRCGMPAFGLFVSSVIMETFLLIVLMAEDVYMTALAITGMMVLPAYLSSGLFLFKATIQRSSLRLDNKTDKWMIGRYRVISLLCSLFCIWMIYAGGLELFMFTSVFYIAGIGFYLRARAERIAAVGSAKRFKRSDYITLGLIAAGLLGTLWHIIKTGSEFTS